jgi:predicted nucleic acid-binding protein
VIFVDSSFWIALNARRDGRHDQAITLVRAHGRSPLVTTNHVVGETWTFLSRRYGHDVAVRFLDGVRATDRVGLAFVGPELEAHAWDWLRRHDEREHSFVDATSFALMRRLAIREALTFGGDFAAAGFVELRP